MAGVSHWTWGAWLFASACSTQNFAYMNEGSPARSGVAGAGGSAHEPAPLGAGSGGEPTVRPSPGAPSGGTGGGLTGPSPMEFRYDFDSAEELKTFRVLNTTKTWDNGEVRLQFDGDGDGLFYLQFVPSVDGTNRTLKVRLRAAATVGVKPWIKSPFWHDWGDKEVTAETTELALDLDALGVDVTRVSQVGIDIWKPDSVWVDAIWSEPSQ